MLLVWTRRIEIVNLNLGCVGTGMRLPTPQQAHDTLVHALQEQASWEQRARSAKELLKELLISRREAADLAAQYDTRCVSKAHGSSLLCIVWGYLLY